MKRFAVIVLILLLIGSVNHAEQTVSRFPEYSLNSDSEPIILQKINEKKCALWVDSVMNKLSLKERVGQLFIYTIAPLENKRNLDLLHNAVSTCHVGGLLFSGGQTLVQASLTNKAQQLAQVPLLITFDGEWGLSMRLKNTPVFPRNMVMGCLQNDSLIFEYGKEVARECREMGVQVNFAPVMDVNVNPNNPVINTRSFGEDPQLVARKAIIYAKGLESGRILSVSKHFPGHGDTDIDSHHALPTLPFNRERLDSIELYPFKQAINAGLSGMMVGHLNVPSIEPVQNLPASLSPRIIDGLLIDELGFNGLVFTDALVMKGVSSHRNVCLQALIAGNDMVLSPPNLKVEIDAVLNAIEKGEISKELIDKKCRKVLTYKYALGLNRKPHIQISGLENRINTPKAKELINQIHLSAITVLSNIDNILPLKQKDGNIGLLEISDKTSLTTLKQQMQKYGSVESFQLAKGLTLTDRKVLQQKLLNCPIIVVAINESKLAEYKPFLDELSQNNKSSKIIYVCFAPAKTLTQIEKPIALASSVILAHTGSNEVQTRVADVLWAKATADGRLSMSIGKLFKAGTGVTIAPPSTKKEVISAKKEMPDMRMFYRVDSIAKAGIKQGAYPGCQIVVLQNGQLVYQQSFGSHTGKNILSVKDTDLFDLASLSKTSGTLLAVMKLYDEGKFNLSDKISSHLTWLKNTDKANITIRELLLHQSGLPAGINFYQELVDKKSYQGNFFSNKQNQKYSVKVGNNLWATPNYSFIEGMTSPTQTATHTLQVTENLWVNKEFAAQMKQMIADIPLKSKQYRYSDLGFILLKYLVEELSGKEMDQYLTKEFYEPMGLDRITYKPAGKFDMSEIIPSNNDQLFRKQLIKGYVHDESSALQGGVSGSAGLFANAEQVAYLYQMLLNGGTFNGKRYLSKETCRLFTTETSKISRRGLGFDKPEPDSKKVNLCSPSTPLNTFGHTGFTGTCAWADPVNNIVYVFLSNRTYPTVLNKKLMQLNIRPEIQEAIYSALKK